MSDLTNWTYYVILSEAKDLCSSAGASELHGSFASLRMTAKSCCKIAISLTGCGVRCAKSDLHAHRHACQGRQKPHAVPIQYEEFQY
jgi:hypothetical protein